MEVNPSLLRPCRHPGNSQPGWPGGNYGYVSGSTWAWADPGAPLPGNGSVRGDGSGSGSGTRRTPTPNTTPRHSGGLAPCPAPGGIPTG